MRLLKQPQLPTRCKMPLLRPLKGTARLEMSCLGEWSLRRCSFLGLTLTPLRRTLKNKSQVLIDTTRRTNKKTLSASRFQFFFLEMTVIVIRFPPMDFCYVHTNKKWCLKLTELFLEFVVNYKKKKKNRSYGDSPFINMFTRVRFEMDRIRYLFGSGPFLSTMDRSVRRVCSHGIGLTS